MGQCLRGKMTGTGMAPAPTVATTGPEATATPTQAMAVAPGAATEAAATPVAPEAVVDVTPPVSSASTSGDAVVAATFGLLRAEPDGSVVIAGSGTPGTEVEVFSDGAPIGRASVESSGDWVLVPQAPLPPGGTELTLAEVGKDGHSSQSFVVVIDEERTAEPLVVASTPGQASEVLQGLERPAAGTQTQVAAVDAPAAPTAAPSAAATNAVPPATSSSEEGAARADTVAPTPPASTPQPAQSVAEAPLAPAGAPTGPAADAAQAVLPLAPPAPDEAPLALAEAQAVPPGNNVPVIAAPTSAMSGEALTEAAPPSAAPQATAAPELPAATPPTPLSVPAPPSVPAVAAAPGAGSASPIVPQPQVSAAPPTIDAIEVEAGRTFFAGSGPEGGTVRLYVDDAFIADATVSDGRWLVESGNVLTKPNQRIRVDLLEGADASVAARAEVNFVLELPAATEPTDVAAVEPIAPPTGVPAQDQAEPNVSAANVEQPEAAGETLAAAATPITPAGQPRPVPEQAITGAAAPATAPIPAQPAPASASSPSSAPIIAAPAAPALPQAPVNPEQPVATAAPKRAPDELGNAAQPQLAGTAPVATTAHSNPPAAVLEAPAPATPDEGAQAALAAPEPDNTVAAAPDVPTMIAVPVGSAEEHRFASGKAIIRRGDNLWTIARRVYGAGMKYTTIYQANTGQIRDPDRIYPGQVFDLPEAGQ
ncbi:MAG: hypothetical protein JWR39_217 [Devosia sp.]|nr:hypothetical protein [Devosia sp.]